MTNLTKSLDWYLDDGINLAMINDWLRNNFFEQSMITTVQDKNCIDVGFGTGLLSILALKHGAKHITAFESDPTRYQLGKSIIEHLDLTTQIDLINDRYSSLYKIDYDYNVLFTETFDGLIWGENFFNSIPRQGNITVIPGQCFAEFSLVPASQALIDRLLNCQIDPGIFAPLVDIQPKFVNFINEIIDQGWRDKSLDNTLTVRQRWQEESSKRKNQSLIYLNNFPQEIIDLYDKILTSTKPVAYYRVDTQNRIIEKLDSAGNNFQPIDFDCTEIKLNIDLSKYTSPAVILIMRTGIEFRNQKLFFDRCINWGLQPARIFRPPYNNLEVSHDMITNKLIFRLI